MNKKIILKIIIYIFLLCLMYRESSLADILEGIPPTFSRQPKAKCVQEGDDVNLECRLVAVPEPEITWFYNNQKIINKENIIVITESDMHMYCSVMKITQILKTQEGKYTIVAKNREGEATIEIPLKVHKMMNIKINY
jgi:hypothetical protein